MVKGVIMSRVAIVTDSSSGFSQSEADSLGIKLIYIPYIIDGEEYIENKNLTREKFFEFLNSASSISTSQPSQLVIKELWDEILKEYDELVYIPLSSGLSATCKMSQLSAEEYKGKVEVVDNKRVSVTLKISVLNALKMAEEGKSAKEIKQELETDTYNSSIYITVTTLKYLKRGGRITATAAAIGSLLKIKPVLQIQGDKLDAYAKVMTMQQAKTKMINAIKKDLETRFKKAYENNEMALAIAHSAYTNDQALAFYKEVQTAFPNLEIISIDSLPLSIICHIGPDSIAMATFKKYKNSTELLNKINLK